MATRLLLNTARAALLRTPSLSCPSRQALSSLHMPAGAGTPTHNTLTLSPALMAATTSTLLSGYELIVCDMAGTTIEEGGMVYETLRQVMVDDGLDVSVEAMHPWHGAKKEAVLEHFARQCDTPLDESAAPTRSGCLRVSPQLGVRRALGVLVGACWRDGAQPCRNPHTPASTLS